MDVFERKKQLMNKWRLKDYPAFDMVPSANEVDELLNIFVNRNSELDRAALTLDENKNVLIRGIMGIGKTAFILVLLNKILQMNTKHKVSTCAIYIAQFVGNSREDFYRIVLYALATQLAPISKEAQNVLEKITGYSITKGRSGSVVGTVEITTGIIKAGLQGSSGAEESSTFEVSHIEYHVNALLDIANKEYDKIIIAIDDMDRSSNQISVKTMLEHSADIIRSKKCAFIFTGRPVTILEDMYGARLGIFGNIIELQGLSNENLQQIVLNILNNARIKAEDDSTYPFPEDVMDSIVDISSGVPRQIMILCGKVLEIAIRENIENITKESFDYIFDKYQDEFIGVNITPDIMAILLLFVQRGKISISKTEDLTPFKNILQMYEIRDLVDQFDELSQANLLQRMEDNQGALAYQIAPWLEKFVHQWNKNLPSSDV